MESLNITISGQSFDHLAYPFVLTYSNWEPITVCHSENFASLSEGLQRALWKVENIGQYEQFLLELARRECEARQTNRMETMLRQSGLPLEKTLENLNRF